MDKHEATGGLAETTIYRMVNKNSKHDDWRIVRDKAMLIGRYYSAPPTRGARKGGGEIVNDVQFSLPKTIAKAIVKIGPNLDALILKINQNGPVSMDNIGSVIDTHSLLNNAVINGIKKWQIEHLSHVSEHKGSRPSFCSKYLHFHAPHAFFIYDSIIN